MKSKMKTCSSCGGQIGKSAKVCPMCGAKQKQPIYKKWWFYFILICFIAGVGGSGEPSSTDAPVTDNQEEVVIEYYACTANQMRDEMDENALKAEEKYNDLYVEVTGELTVIDSDGKYISLAPMNEYFAISNVQCYIKSDEQCERLMELSTGEKVTVQGKVNSVGEVMGYSVDIDKIL